jgi:hypothetical protein
MDLSHRGIAAARLARIPAPPLVYTGACAAPGSANRIFFGRRDGFCREPAHFQVSTDDHAAG